MESPISKVYNEDCLIGMKRYPDKYFDLAIVDPPYGINEKGRLNQGAGKLKNRFLNKSIIDWNFAIPTQEYFTELSRVSKNQIIWGAIIFIYHQLDVLLFGIRFNRGKTSLK